MSEDSTSDLTQSKNIHQSSTDIQQPRLVHKPELIELRQSKVLELLAKGWSQSAIAKSMGVHKSLISLDVKQMMQEAVQQQESLVKNIFREQLKCLTGLDLALQRLWNIVEHSNDSGEVMQAISQIAKIYSQRLEIQSGKIFKDATSIKEDHEPEQVSNAPPFQLELEDDESEWQEAYSTQ